MTTHDKLKQTKTEKNSITNLNVVLLLTRVVSFPSEEKGLFAVCVSGTSANMNIEPMHFNVGPLSTTLARHWGNIGSMPRFFSEMANPSARMGGGL